MSVIISQKSAWIYTVTFKRNSDLLVAKGGNVEKKLFGSAGLEEISFIIWLTTVELIYVTAHLQIH